MSKGIRRISINIVLCVAFIMLAARIVMPFLSSMHFIKGEDLEADYRWGMADERFASAVYLDSMNAEYHAGIGKAYTLRAAILRDKSSMLLKAENEYKKARELNPFSADYSVGLSAVEADLFLVDAGIYANRLSNSVSHLKEAARKDRYNYVIDYAIAQQFLKIWPKCLHSHSSPIKLFPKLRTCNSASSVNASAKQSSEKIKQFILISHSFGNLVALEFMKHHENMVEKLVLLSAGHDPGRRIVARLIKPLLILFSYFDFFSINKKGGHIDYSKHYRNHIY